jgi:CRP/FNR family transcriptional regulator, dissimilatory nitrate respiration regulator
MNQADREKTCLPLLESAPGFAAIPQEALRFIAGGCHTRTAARGRVLCEKGQTTQGFYVVVSGRVKLSILSAEGAERVLDIVLPGGTFAEAAAFLDAPCPLHAVALSDSRLVFVDLPRVREAIARWPEVASLMLAMVARRTLRLTADLEACCLHSASQRVAGFLLREATADAVLPDRAQITLPAAKTVIASRLNLSAETFSRELHGLAHRGLVEVARREIRIPSLERLRTLAGLQEA